MNLLVVIDMVNGFINKGNLADKNIMRIVPNIQELLNEFIKKDYKIIFFKDTHSENDEEFKIFPYHCVKGSEECLLIDELKIYESKGISIEKNTTNGFLTKEFQNFIKSNNFNKIIITGCCTDICVYNFVESLKKYLTENNRRDNIIVVEDAVDTFTQINHLADDVNREYLLKMENLNVDIKTTNEIIILGE